MNKYEEATEKLIHKNYFQTMINNYELFQNNYYDKNKKITNFLFKFFCGFSLTALLSIVLVNFLKINTPIINSLIIGGCMGPVILLFLGDLIFRKYFIAKEKNHFENLLKTWLEDLRTKPELVKDLSSLCVDKHTQKSFDLLIASLIKNKTPTIQGVNTFIYDIQFLLSHHVLFFKEHDYLKEKDLFLKSLSISVKDYKNENKEVKEIVPQTSKERFMEML